MPQDTLIDIWKNLPTTLIDKAMSVDAGDVSQLMRLRKKYSAEQVKAAIDLARARTKAQIKFPDIAATIIADASAVEMASSMVVARHKAKRFASYENVWDLCCGIGGDMLALREVADDVVGYEMDPLRSWMCEQNTGKKVVVGDVTETAWHDGIFHIDPTRRNNKNGNKQRLWRFEDVLPGPAFLEQLVKNNRGGCIKLAPSTNQEDLPFDAELEYISENGRLVQGLAWTGELHKNLRSATVVRDQQTHCFSYDVIHPAHDYIDNERKYLYTVDPAIERAELMGNLAASIKATIVHEKLGLLTSDEKLESPSIRGFEVIEIMGWKEARIKNWLREHDAGLVEIKTRDKVVNPDTLQIALRGQGNVVYTLFILRKDKQVITYITKRL